MLSTALQAVALAAVSTPGHAQTANARPTGGQVMAGQASIGGNSSTTLITQGSEKAAINWQSYNIGSAQTVRYAQPNAAAVTLNTVTSANPSLVAGKIIANGQIIIVNQSGVVFTKGSQVDTAGLVVSSAGISLKDFMAGRLVFNQPGHPGAAISNAGNITIRQAGLAALVAPQVANSGLITAKLGRVILGGAATETLDLYGDGLVSLNITGQVTQVSLNGKLVPALVTNTGTILAPGGTIVLSAAAADSVVTNLVDAGGTIAAPTAGAQTGRVLVQGIGGDITIDGQVSATGLAANTTGGQIVANATGTVSVAPGASIDASGAAGGGVIALGTTAARAIGGPSVHSALTANTVDIGAGARIAANATSAGRGGRIAALSRQTTTQDGTITATGGAAAGNGGWIEVSGKNLGLGGIIDAGAPRGATGSILLDPANIVIGPGSSSGDTLFVSQAELSRFSGNVILDAGGDLTLAANITLSSKLVKTLQLEGDEGIFIDAVLNAPGIAVALKSTDGAITNTSSGNIIASSISATAGGPIDLIGLNANTTLAPFSSIGTVFSGVVATLDVDGIAVGSPATAANAIGPLAGITSAGTIDISVAGTTANSTPNTLAVTGDVSGTNVTLAVSGTDPGFTGNAFSQTAGTITATGASIGTNVGVVTTPGTLSISTASGSISLAGANLTETPGVAIPSGLTTITAIAGDISEASTGSIDTGTLSGSAGGSGKQNTPPAGNANFAISAGNTISTLTAFSTSGSFSLEDDTGLVVSQVNAASGTISIAGPSGAGNTEPTGSLTIAGSVTAGGAITLSNGLGITELADVDIASTGGGVSLVTGGSIAQQTGATIEGGIPSATGTAVSLAAGAGITLDGTITAGSASQPGGLFSGLADLAAAAGNIVESATAALQAGTLSGSAHSSTPGSGNISLTASTGNAISLIDGLTATGNIDIQDGPVLTLDAINAGGTIGITDQIVLALSGSISATGSISLSADQGIAELKDATVSSTAGGISLLTDGAIGQDSGATLAGGESSGSGTALTLHASGSTDFSAFLTGTTLGLVNGISFAGTLTAGSLSLAGYTGSANLVASSGEILEGATGRLRAATLSGSAAGTPGETDPQAGDALFNPSAGNSLGVLGSFTASGDFALETDTGLEIGTLSAGGGIDVFGSSNPGGTLLVNGPVSATQNIQLSNAAGITLNSGASVASTLSGVTLTSASGGITEQAGASLSGGEASSAGTAILLSAARNIGIGGSVTAGTLATGGTAYTGEAMLEASNGNVTEGQQASIYAGTLSGDAASTGGSSTTAGNAGLTGGLGNAIGTLTGFTAGSGFTLEDDTGLTIGNLVSDGAITISGPSGASQFAPGILVISGDVTGAASVSLNNALGIVELSRAAVSSTSGGVTLASSGGAILQETNATLSGGESSATGTALLLKAGGTTDYDTYLPADGFGTVSGISFAGALTAGTLSSGAYTGQAVLTDSSGDILDQSVGILRAGTLTANASGSGTQATPAGNLLLNVSAGDQIGTLAATAATGNVTLEDDSGLTILALSSGGTIAIAGPSGTVNPKPSGALVIDGPVSAPGSITLSNAIGITEQDAGSILSTLSGISLDTGGAITQQSGASITAGEASSAGTALSLSAGSGMTLAGTLTAGTLVNGVYTGLTDLAASGGTISQTGSLRTGTLTGDSTHGDMLLDPNAGNLIGTLAGISAGGNVAIEDDSGLTLTGSLTADGTVGIGGPVGASATPSGILVIDGTIRAPGEITLSNALGIAELAAGTVTSTAGGIVLASAKGAIVQQEGGVLDGELASTSGTGLSLTAGGTTDFDTYLPNDGLGTVSGVSFSGLLRAGNLSNGAYGGLADLTAQAGDVTETATGTLQTGTLSGAATGNQAGNASFDLSASNVIATLTGFTTTGNFALDAGGLTLGALSSGGSIAIASAPGAGGILVIEGAVSAQDGISLTNAKGIAELTGASVTSTTSGLFIQSGGAIAQQQGASLTGREASNGGDGIYLQAEGETAFNLYLPSASLGLVNGISFAGTLTAGVLSGLAYSGEAVLATAGDILEGGTGSLRAQFLCGEALCGGTPFSPPATNALLDPASGNVIGTVFNVRTSGNFVLEDDSGLTVNSLTSGGSIDIKGPSSFAPTGVLTISHGVSAQQTISLSNSLGIIELSGASLATALGNITLTSGGAILQQSQASIFAGTGTAAGAALSLTANGTTDFGTFLPGQGLGTVQGIEFAGTLQTAPTTNAPYGGKLSLFAPGNAILEEPTGEMLAGTLTGHALANADFGIQQGNSLSVLGSFSAGGDFALENDTALTVTGPVTAQNISITSQSATGGSGILIIDGSIAATSTAAGAGTITLSNGLGILETGTGSVDAGTFLALASGGAIVQLAGGDLSLASAGTVSLTAAGQTNYAPYASFGTISGIALGGTLAAGTTPNAAGPFSGTAVIVAKAGGITETSPGAAAPSGSIRAGSLTAQAGTAGGAAYDITLDTDAATIPANQIGTLFGTDRTPFFASGAITIADNGSAFTRSGIANVSLTGAMQAAGGSLSLGIYGANLTINDAGALPVSAATGLTLSTTSGPVSNGDTLSGSIVQDHGTITAETITLLAGKAFSQLQGAVLSAAGGANPSIGITAEGGGANTLSGSPVTVQGIEAGGTLQAASVTLAALQGDISQAAQGSAIQTGVIEAASLSVTAEAGTLAGAGNISLTTSSSATSGNQIAGLGASSAGGAFALADGTGLTVTGAVQAGLTADTPSALALIAPAIDVTTGSLAIAPPNGVAPGILSLVADQFSFASPGDVSTQGGIVALDLLGAPGSTAAFGIGPGATVTAASLGDIATHGGTLALGSLDGTRASPATTNEAGWTVGQGGQVDRISIAAGQPLSLNNTAAALGLFTDAANGQVSGIADLGGISVASLYGAAEGAFTQGATTTNAVGTLGIATPSGLFGFSTQQAPGSAPAFAFTDGISLEVVGPIAATLGAVDISVTGTTGGTGNSLTLGGALTSNGPSTGGDITGSDVFLTAAGNIVQSAGIISATGATATPPQTSTNGTIGLLAGGGISLAGTVLGGTATDGTPIIHAQSAVLLEAGAGDITETGTAQLAAGTLAAQAGGNILLAAGNNAVSVIAPLAAGADGLNLTGLAAAGSQGIAFIDQLPLLVADGAVISAYGPAGLTGPGTGSINLSVAAGTLALGTSTGATIAAPGAITLTAPLGIVQTGGLIAAGGNLALSAGTPSASGTIATFGGTLTAGGSASLVVSGPAGGAADIVIGTLTAGQTVFGSLIDASQDVTLSSATGSYTQTASSVYGSNSVTLDVPGAIVLSGGGTIASPGTGAAGSGTVILAGSSLTLDGIVAGGGSFGTVFTPAASSSVLLSASAGDITETAAGAVYAGTLSAGATGNIALTGQNQVGTIAGQSAALAGEKPQTITLAGLTATGGAGISFTDAASLAIVQATGAPIAVRDATSGATLTLTDDGVVQTGASPIYGSVTLLGAADTELAFDGNIAIAAPGSILIQGAGIQSAHGAVGLASANGSVSQQSSSVISAATGVGITAGGDVDQSFSSITTPGNIGIVAGGTINQTDLGSLSAGGTVSLTAGGGFSQSNATIAGGQSALFSLGGDFNSESSGISGGTLVSITTGGSLTFVSDANALATGNTGTVLLSAAGSIFVDPINTGTLAAASGGSVAIAGNFGTIAALGGFAGITAQTGGIDIADLQGLTVLPGASILAPSAAGTILVDADTLLLQSATIATGGDIALSADGPSFDQAGGLIQSANGNVAIAGQTVSQSTGATIEAAQTVSIGASSGLSLAGRVQAGADANGIFGGALSLSAGSAGISATGVLQAGTLAATSAGAIGLGNGSNAIATIGTAGSLTGLSAQGSITLLDDQSLTGAAPVSATAAIQFVTQGDFTQLAGAPITTPGALTIDASGAVLIAGALRSGPLTVAAGGPFTESAGATIGVAGTAGITSGGAIDIDGGLTTTGAAHLTAATDLTETATGLITIPAPATLTAPGTITLDGRVDVPGSLAIAAGTDVSLAPQALIDAGTTTITATTGTASLGGTLDIGGALSVTAGGAILQSAGGVIDGGAVSFTARTGAIGIDGSLHASPSLTLAARTDVSLAPGALIDAGSAAITATAGSATLDGTLDIGGALHVTAGVAILQAAGGIIASGPTALATRTGAIDIAGLLQAAPTLAIAAGSDFTEAASGTIAAGALASVTAPGTITLAGTLTAPTILLGAQGEVFPKPRDVVFDGNTIRTGTSLRGSTNAIDELNPLTGGQGLFIDADAFRQTGTSIVAPLGGKGATMQLTIPGGGTAQFASLDAPATQLLLVLENAGFASGTIDVAGLNVFYTQGRTPSQAVNLFGTVGAHTGTAAAAVGFAHLNSNINYQLNGCPIQSINCVLLSPIVLPVVDPVSDYEVDTQRKRRQDDDALPNVGEEDY